MSSSRMVHLVGSIRLPGGEDSPFVNYPSPSDVFTAITAALPGRLQRIPDGETGLRYHFISWQVEVFLQCPWILNHWVLHAKSLDPLRSFLPLGRIQLRWPRYDEYAIKSFQAFEKLQAQNIIESGVRFQICIPTPLQAICVFVNSEYRAEVEPMYAQLLQRTIAKIQECIPHEKLAFQFDCALEFAMLEGLEGIDGIYKPWFQATPENLAGKIVEFVDVVHPDAQLGFHLCYGDNRHKHFIEPKDTAKLVNMANLLTRTIRRPINFVHLPVPKGRLDDAYFKPLKELQLSAETDVFLGVVHPNDLDGTQKRIAAASKILPEFGIATECGWGRTPVGDIDSILDTLRQLSGPADAQS